jgi:hypothetical protein
VKTRLLAAVTMTAASLALSVATAGPGMAKDEPRSAPVTTSTTAAPVKYLTTLPTCPAGTRHSRPLTKINANNVEVLVSHLCFTYGLDEDTDDARLLAALDGRNYATTVVNPGGHDDDLHIIITNKLNGRVGYHKVIDNGRTWLTLIP